MAEKKPSVIRPGDRVRILDPQVFIRCGYPLTLREVEKEMADAHSGEIIAFVEKTLGLKFRDHGLLSSPDLTPREHGDMSRIIRALAGFEMRRRGFGGKERRIYTKEAPWLKGKESEVVEVKRVVTGDYDRGWSSQDYFGEWDYEGPALVNQKHHFILRLKRHTSDGWPMDGKTGKIRMMPADDDFHRPLRIERCHVEKIEEEKDGEA